MSGGIVPKSMIYANKDIYIPKEERKDYREAHYSKRAKKIDAIKNWEQLASDLERDIEDCVQSEEWKDETDLISDEPKNYRFINLNSLFYHESREIEVSENSELEWGRMTIKGNLTKFL